MAPLPFTVHHQPVPGPLARWCTRLVAVEIADPPPLSLTVLPHGSFVLTVRLSRDAGQAADGGAHTHLCGLRRTAHRYRPVGHCVTYLAQLTPEAGLLLARGQPLPSGGGPRVRLAELVDPGPLATLEEGLALSGAPAQKLAHFARWLQDRLHAPAARLPAAAARAVAAASDIVHRPAARPDDIARLHGLGRRQLERDLSRWLGQSPKQLAMVARVQRATRAALEGMPLVDVAHAQGFADQAHMTHQVRRVAGRAPAALLRCARTPANATFVQAAGREIIYLADPAEAAHGPEERRLA